MLQFHRVLLIAVHLFLLYIFVGLGVCVGSVPLFAQVNILIFDENLLFCCCCTILLDLIVYEKNMCFVTLSWFSNPEILFASTMVGFYLIINLIVVIWPIIIVNACHIAVLLGIFNILGGCCDSSPVSFASTKWKCGQFDWAICFLSWVCILLYLRLDNESNFMCIPGCRINHTKESGSENNEKLWK